MPEVERVAAIYARVSTDEQELQSQIAICQRYAEINNIKLFKIYSDVLSGKEQSRPNFNAMIEDMRCFKFNTIIVTKLDRIGRSLSHLLSLFAEFKLKGMNFIATSQNIDTSTSAGQLQMQILGAFAEFERNLISERTKEALKYIKRTKQLKIRGRDKAPRKKSGYYARWAREKSINKHSTEQGGDKLPEQPAQINKE